MSQILLSRARRAEAAAAGFGPLEVAGELDGSVLRSAQWACTKPWLQSKREWEQTDRGREGAGRENDGQRGGVV